jgi:DNA-binding NarL/FixJ family response regulator
MKLSRECIAMAIRKAARDLVITEGSTCRSLPAAKPDIVLFNINSVVVGDQWVMGSIAEIKLNFGDVPIIILSDISNENAALRAVSMGLRGYVPTTEDVGMLVAAIHLVLAGGTFVPDGVVTSYAKRYSNPDPPEDGVVFLGFTTRETQVVEKIREGKINKVIAYELNISESTVKIHVRHVMKKLNANNRTHVAFLVDRRAREAATNGGA